MSRNFYYENERGKVYNNLTIVSFKGYDKYKHPLVEAICDCGNYIITSFSLIKRGVRKSCGCRKWKYKFLKDIPKNLCAIYKITAPSGVAYIGQTRELPKRWGHIIANKDKENNLSISFINNGVLNHKFEILHQLPRDVSSDVLDRYEQLYMDAYRDCGVQLFNIREGGRGGKHSKVSINKMKGKNGKWMLGRKIPKNVIDKIVNTRRSNNKSYTADVIEKYRQQQIGDSNSMAKLKGWQVLEIIKLRVQDKWKYNDLAIKYGVSKGAVSNIFNGHNWSHLTGIKNKYDKI